MRLLAILLSQLCPDLEKEHDLRHERTAVHCRQLRQVIYSIRLLFVLPLFENGTFYADNVKALTPTEEDEVTAEDLGLQGTDCTCPLECEETMYHQEMSQARLRQDSRFFKKLKKEPFARWRFRQRIEKVNAYNLHIYTGE